jgi:hypothetical protein
MSPASATKAKVNHSDKNQPASRASSISKVDPESPGNEALTDGTDNNYLKELQKYVTLAIANLATS